MDKEIEVVPRTSLSALVVATSMLFVGCEEAVDTGVPLPAPAPTSEATETPTDNGGDTPDSDTQPQESDQPQEINLQVVDKQGYEEVLKQHRGKVVLVDFWASWCIPCRREFPHTVEWSKSYADDLAVVAVSLDEPDEEETVAEVKDFLQSQEARFDTLLSKFGGSTTESYDVFEIESGALPHYKIYDRSGQLFQKFENDPDDPPDHAKIEAALKEALAQPANETPSE